MGVWRFSRLLMISRQMKVHELTVEETGQGTPRIDNGQQTIGGTSKT